MNIALFQSYPFHYEMLGFIIEYCNKNNLNYTVYCNMETNKHNEWKLYYEENFNIKIKWENILEFNHIKYNYIVVLTDSDSFLCNSSSNKKLLPDNIYNTKIITINHYGETRSPKVYKEIACRFNGCFDINYMIPSYYQISLKEKINLLKQTDKIQICIIGGLYPKKIDYLKKIFLNYNDINFNIFMRVQDINFNNEFCKESNVFIRIDYNIIEMMNIIKQSHYIFCTDFNELHKNLTTSGSIPLAFGTFCQLIIPESWNDNYLFNSVIEYNEKTKITLTKDINYIDIENEVEKIMLQRFNVLDDVFNIQKIFEYKSSFKNILNAFKNNFKIKKINILYELSNNKINLFDLIKDFIKIYSHTDDIYNNHFIKCYNNESNIEFNIKNINENILFFIDFEHYINNIYNILKNIGLRSFDDVIIIYISNSINNFLDTVRTIIRSIKKQMYHIYTNNLLIIMKQK